VDRHAVLLVMFNKAALSSYKFPCANVITVLQVRTSVSIHVISVPVKLRLCFYACTRL
jgi:hypothetical protein